MSQLDAWLFEIEDHVAAGVERLPLKLWWELRELARIANPDEDRLYIKAVNAADLVYAMQGQLFGPEEEEE